MWNFHEAAAQTYFLITASSGTRTSQDVEACSIQRRRVDVGRLPRMTLRKATGELLPDIVDLLSSKMNRTTGGSTGPTAGRDWHTGRLRPLARLARRRATAAPFPGRGDDVNVSRPERGTSEA